MNGINKGVDWVAIEHECRATDLTLKSIATKHQVSYPALWERSKNHGWRRKIRIDSPREAKEPASDCIPGDSGVIGSLEGASTVAGGAETPPAVSPPATAANGNGYRKIGDMRDPTDPRAIPLHRTLVAYVNTRHEPGSENAYREKAVLEGAALQLEMIRQYRGDIRSARELALALMAQLHDAAGNRAALIEAIYEFTEAGPKRAAMERAVKLPTHIAAMRDLSTTLRQHIPLERQALGIPNAQPIEPQDPRDPVDHVAERIELAELEAAIEQQLARGAPKAEGMDGED